MHQKFIRALFVEELMDYERISSALERTEKREKQEEALRLKEKEV